MSSSNLNFEAAKNVEPTPNALLVTNISTNASSKTVKDFFSFCGEIKSFELTQNPEEGDQAAFLLFETASEANTARMLTNAVILDKPVVVKSYFPGTGDEDTRAAESLAEQDSNSLPSYAESQSDNDSLKGMSGQLLSTLTNLLASGYQVSDNVAQRGVALDKTYGVSTNFNKLLGQAKSEVMKLEDKYHVMHVLQQRAAALDQSLNLTGTAQSAVNRAFGMGQTALGTPTGQKLKDTARTLSSQAIKVHQEARGIATARQVEAEERANPSGTERGTDQPTKEQEAATSANTQGDATQ